MRRLFPALALLAAIAAASPASAKPEDAQVGQVRAVFARKGTALLEEPKAMSARVVRTLPEGQRFTILEKRGAWFRVQTLGGEGAATGWVRASQTVSPYTMSGAGRAGPTTTGSRLRSAAGRGTTAARGFTRAETAAAGRGLREDTLVVGRGFNHSHVEAAAAKRPDVRKGLALLDQVIGRTPAPKAVRHFQTSGGLGR